MTTATDTAVAYATRTVTVQDNTSGETITCAANQVLEALAASTWFVQDDEYLNEAGGGLQVALMLDSDAHRARAIEQASAMGLSLHEGTVPA